MTERELTEQDVREAQLESFYHLLMAKKTLMLVGDGSGGEAISALEDAERALEKTLGNPTLSGTN